jgi:hypothetical protein
MFHRISLGLFSLYFLTIAVVNKRKILHSLESSLQKFFFIPLNHHCTYLWLWISARSFLVEVSWAYLDGLEVYDDDMHISVR